jgi:exosome complex RNA-binding protein Csl4
MIARQARVPKEGEVILGRVISVAVDAAIVEIATVEDSVLQSTFLGQVRRDTALPPEIESVDLHACFRPGDIVRAAVLSLGSAQYYVLTTSEKQFGVVLPRKELGLVVSDNQIRNPGTNRTEERKLALKIE